MPLYEFKCQDCRETFEFLTSSDKKEPETCPECSSTKLEKLLSAFSVNASPTSSAGPKPECGGCSSGGCPFAGKS